jgi:hypothetical protein
MLSTSLLLSLRLADKSLTFDLERARFEVGSRREFVAQSTRFSHAGGILHRAKQNLPSLFMDFNVSVPRRMDVELLLRLSPDPVRSIEIEQCTNRARCQPQATMGIEDASKLTASRLRSRKLLDDNAYNYRILKITQIGCTALDP